MSAERIRDDGGKDDDFWPSYYDKTEGQPPRETLLRALESLKAEGRAQGEAVDLGAGAGRDTLELLRLGWRVLAVDPEPEGLERLKAAAESADLPGRLRLRQAHMEESSLPPADLINASFCLFTLDRPVLEIVLRSIKKALRPGGRFAGHLLGPRDSWCASGKASCVAREEVAGLLAPLEIEALREEEDEGTTPRGEHKRWHIFHIVARKPD